MKPLYDKELGTKGLLKMSPITKLSDVKELVKQAVNNPQQAFPAIMDLAGSNDWKEREVAATILVEVSKKNSATVLEEMLLWAEHNDPNIRRTASEGLRYIARKNPELVLPVIDKLKTDSNLYVKKSVANILRNAGNYYPDFVLKICSEWAVDKNPHTDWIIKDGLRKIRKM